MHVLSLLVKQIDIIREAEKPFDDPNVEKEIDRLISFNLKPVIEEQQVTPFHSVRNDQRINNPARDLSASSTSIFCLQEEKEFAAVVHAFSLVGFHIGREDLHNLLNQLIRAELDDETQRVSGKQSSESTKKHRSCQKQM
jgi:hypothetical protein